MKTFSFALLALLLNVIGVFSLGGAFDVAAGLGYADPLNPAFRGMSGILGISALVLALRFWLRAFGINPLLGMSDD